VRQVLADLQKAVLHEDKGLCEPAACPCDCRVAAEESGAVTQEALDDQVEAFMKRQAELESGGELLLFNKVHHASLTPCSCVF
jgi:hypothetical protein